MNTKPILEIKNFSKTYGGGKKAADDITLTINSGDICGFIGHNGAGKYTTIRAAVSVLDFTEGDIRINGYSVKRDPVKCKEITAYIPDNPDIYEDLTGIEYLSFISDAFGITDSLGELIRSYSHGMRQKIAIISALIHEPKLLVLDEPFVGLDPKATFMLKEIMREMCSRGSAVFFSTHVLDATEKLCNRVAIIKEGRIVASGTMDELTKEKSLEDVFLEVDSEEE